MARSGEGNRGTSAAESLRGYGGRVGDKCDRWFVGALARGGNGIRELGDVEATVDHQYAVDVWVVVDGGHCGPVRLGWALRGEIDGVACCCERGNDRLQGPQG